MNKLMTSLACTAVLSMSLAGTGFASHEAGTAGVGGTMQARTGTTMDGTVNNYGTGNYPARDGNMLNQTENMMNRGVGAVERGINRATGTNNNTDTITTDRYRSYNNLPTSPISNDRVTGRYRATSTTTNATTNNNNNSNWGWLGLLGLIGLAGMRSRSRER